jgi:hypothetical protein
MPRGTDRYDEARLQGRLWTPQLERPNLGIWYDAADLSTVSIATGVSELRDKSGNARHATQAAGVTQPEYETNGSVFRHSVLNFTQIGSGQALEVPNLSATGWSSLESLYVWANYFDPGGGAATQFGAPLGRWSTDAVNGDLEPYVDGTIYHGFGSTARKTVGNPTPSLTLPRISGMRSAANDWRYFLDGTLFFATATNTVGLPTAPRLGFSTTAGCTCRIGELLLFNSSLTDLRRQRAEGYLAWKWGLVANLPGSHPYKNRPPLIGG